MNIKRLIPAAFISLMAFAGATSCMSSAEETWNDYADWRNTNLDWLHEQEVSGKYERVVPIWNDSLYVLMRWLNDTTLTSGNLVPLYTSEIAVTYKGCTYDGVGFDSTYLQPDSIVTMSISDVITGWAIAMERIHVGDEVEVVIPYQSGYGASGYGVIPPYSSLLFSINLRDIPAYEIKH